MKTPALAGQLQKLGAGDNIKVIPVCLDESILKQDYAEQDITALKKKWGYQPQDKVLLFIGRMTSEKQPLKMIELFGQLYAKDKNYKLLMIGQGELSERVKQAISQASLDSVVTLIEKIENSKIWEAYRLAYAYVNLNEHEIFGMSILEAMYYECPVVALEAPGPDYIMEHGRYGFLCKDEKEICDKLDNTCLTKDIDASKDRISIKFMWQESAKIFIDIINLPN